MTIDYSQLTLPKGTLVVVTGANGYIGSNIVDQLLTLGYRVRGTVRNAQRSEWLEEYFNSNYGAEKFELVEVRDMAGTGAFDDHVHGASGFIHVATPVMQSYNPNTAVPTTVNGILNVLRACGKEPGVSRVVMTSSSTAAASPQPNKVFTIDENTWNTSAVEAAWAPPPYEGDQRRLDVYSASKMQSEKEAWQFVKEHDVGFVLNAVLPNANMGKILSVKDQGYPSTAGWIKALWNGFEGHEELKANTPQYYINVQDNARVHVAALLFPDVKNERLFSFAHPYTWNDILAIFRKKYPNHKTIDDLPDLGQDLSKVANGRALELVKRLKDGQGWTSLEESVVAIADTFEA